MLIAFLRPYRRSDQVMIGLATTLYEICSMQLLIEVIDGP